LQDYVEKERNKKRKARDELREFRETYGVKSSSSKSGGGDSNKADAEEEEAVNGLEQAEGEDASAKKQLNLFRLRNEMYGSFFVTRRVRQWALW
jgi:hypothetical protein